MKFNIISWGLNDKIVFDISNGWLELVDEKNISCNKRYCKKYLDDTIDVVMVDYNEEILLIRYLNEFEKVKSRKILIVEKIDGNNIAIINEIYKSYNLFIIVGSVELGEDEKLKYNNLLNNIIYLVNIIEEQLNLNTFILTIINNYLKGSNIALGEKVIIGYEDGKSAIGKIVMNILKKFNYISRLKRYNIVLQCKKELGLDEITYIEDPLNQYIADDAKLIVKQLINENYGDRIYFLLVGIS